ncbi:MAG TPA: hypothetical protein PKZ76_02595, partial [Xanthomonadaceae bacterium]|nr:hypothetical protein [Xanthomonadaceae bacterium]
MQPLAAPLILDQVTVAGGRFAVGVDFPELPDQIASGWLEVAVMAEDESDFWPLPEKQPVVLKAQLCPESWALAGNASTNPAVNFLGTTDSQPLVLRTRNAQSLRIEPSSELLDGLPITANVVAGSHANAVAAGVRGATIAGGGMPGGNSDPQFIESSPNLVSDHYGGVGGGYGNRAGDSAGTPSDAAFAYVGGGRLNTASSPASTVSGGAGNSASGTASAIGGGWANTASGTTSAVGGGFGNLAGGSNSAVSGGEFNVASNAWSTVAGGWGNTASGIYSAVPGGRNNCAGGLDSWAGGHNAKVRPHADPFDGFACSGLASYPGGDGDRGTFVWADSQGGVFVSSGANQFLVRATGGMALNGLPINDAVELNVVADNDGPNYANLFLRQRDFNAGILVSAGDATGTAA